jgi:hypothetical protein
MQREPIQIELDADVAVVITFMQRALPATALTKVANALPKLAAVLWGPEPIIRIGPPPIRAQRSERPQQGASGPHHMSRDPSQRCGPDSTG